MASFAPHREPVSFTDTAQKLKRRMVISWRINVFRQEHDSRRPFAAGETVSLFKLSFNRAFEVEVRPDRTSSDAGALAAREVLEGSGVMDWLSA